MSQAGVLPEFWGFEYTVSPEFAALERGSEQAI